MTTPFYQAVAGRTFSNPADIGFMIAALRDVEAHGVPGAVVECGVCQGGTLKAALLWLETYHCQREVWGYDTFAGMTTPGPQDRASADQTGKLAVPYDEVRAYLGDWPRLIVGDIRETAAATHPEQIAVLRLDVDWYENTLAALQALWPRLQPGGFLFIDDYNYWEGCKRAVDEYLGPAAEQLVRTGTGSGLIK